MQLSHAPVGQTTGTPAHAPWLRGSTVSMPLSYTTSLLTHMHARTQPQMASCALGVLLHAVPTL